MTSTSCTAALVETALQLPIAQYEPGDPTSFMYKIVDAAGHNAGYDTFVTKMLGEATAARARVEYKRQLVSISGTAAAPVLHFAAGDDVKPGRVLLNLPQLPLLQLLSASPALTRGRPFPPALMAPSPTEGAKLYVYYSDAWWRNTLGLTSGEFYTSGAHNRSQAVTLTQRPSLAGRYHDGELRCAAAGGVADEPRLHRARRRTYGDNARWFLAGVGSPAGVDGIYTTLNASDGAAGAFVLQQVHEVLVEYHKAALENASTPGHNATAAVAAMRPPFALLSYWGAQLPTYGGAIHQTKPGPLIDEGVVAPNAMAPFGDWPVYVANEAFGALRGEDGGLGGHHGWAECSLVMAENVLVEKMGLKPPAWIDAAVYHEYVRHNKTKAAKRGGWAQG